eukprot:s1900_g5.t1
MLKNSVESFVYAPFDLNNQTQVHSDSTYPVSGIKSNYVLDEANCGYVMREDKVREHRSMVVTDRHALAAHELWHRRTGGIWMDPQFIGEQQCTARSRYSCSGQLMSLERMAPEAKPRPGVAVPGPVKVRLLFEALDVETRQRRWLPLRLADKDYLTPSQNRMLQERLAGTDRAVGRVRVIDIVGGNWMADMRQIARHEYSAEERGRKAEHVQRILQKRHRKDRSIQATVGFILGDRELYDKALAGEASNSEAPSIMGVHRVPLALQLLYMVGVVAAVSYVVFLVVRQLTARDKEGLGIGQTAGYKCCSYLRTSTRSSRDPLFLAEGL